MPVSIWPFVLVVILSVGVVLRGAVSWPGGPVLVLPDEETWVLETWKWKLGWIVYFEADVTPPPATVVGREKKNEWNPRHGNALESEEDKD